MDTWAQRTIMAATLDDILRVLAMHEGDYTIHGRAGLFQNVPNLVFGCTLEHEDREERIAFIAAEQSTADALAERYHNEDHGDYRSRLMPVVDGNWPPHGSHAALLEGN